MFTDDGVCKIPNFAYRFFFRASLCPILYHTLAQDKKRGKVSIINEKHGDGVFFFFGLLGRQRQMTGQRRWLWTTMVALT
jgi:hypothetical protein